MDNFIINRSQPTTVQFEMNVDGASMENVKPRLVIKCEKYSVFFDCFRTNQKTFTCEIPPVPFIEKTVHNFTIEVIIDQQIFTPLSGSVTVVDDVKVEISPVKSTDTNIKNLENEETKATTSTTILNADNVLKLLQTRNAAEESINPEIKQKELKVREILESMNLVTKPPKKKISLKKLAEKSKTKNY